MDGEGTLAAARLPDSVKTSSRKRHCVQSGCNARELRSGPSKSHTQCLETDKSNATTLRNTATALPMRGTALTKALN